jgi:hypothetical protein
LHKGRHGDLLLVHVALTTYAYRIEARYDVTAITARRFSLGEMTFRVPDRGSGNPTPLGGMGSPAQSDLETASPTYLSSRWNRTTDPSPVVPCTRKSAISLRKALRSNIAV